MNNKIFHSLFFLCLLAAWGGCTMEPLPGGGTEEGTDVTVRFTASIPDYKVVTTRADAHVSDMWLLVFNENGNLIARRNAVITSQNDEGGTFTVTLPASTKPRTVHFITNYDWTGFDDAAMLGASEAEAVALLATETPAFWARVELNSGISASSFANNVVELLRNRAKITVSVSTDAAKYFKVDGFTVHNRPDKGTVAPFDANTGIFLTGTITEPQGVGLVTAVESEVNKDESYLFERKNSTANEITTVIIKGTLNEKTSFYKIDLVDSLNNRYDIERNYHYAITIQSVENVGQTDFDNAVDGAPHNNTSLYPIIEKYPMISDGVSKLQVEKTLVLLTQGGESFEVWAKYFPDKDSPAFDNTGVNVEIQQGNTALDAASLKFDPVTGIISATALNQTTGEARIIVSQGNLARVIRVELRKPFSFEPITINGEKPGIVVYGQSQNAILEFIIPPDDFPEELFPLPIKIYTQGLYAGEEGMELEVEEGTGLIYYVYYATTTGGQEILFKTNHSGYSETVTLTADYFEDGSVDYNPDRLKISISGTIQYGSLISWNNVPINSAVTVTGIDYPVMIVDADGHYILTVPDSPDDTEIKFSYVTKFLFFETTYTLQTTFGTLKGNPNIKLN